MKPTNSWVKPWSKRTVKVTHNPHIWAIIFIILGLSFIYYADFFFFNLQNSWPWLRQLKLFEFNYDLHGILFTIPVIYATLIFWWRGALVTWLISLAIILPQILYYLPDTTSLFSNILFLLVPLMVVIYISIELNWRDKERKSLTEREIERQSFISQIFKAQEVERQWLARELHDGPTQTLLVMATRAQVLSSHENVKNVSQSREQAQWIKDTAISVSEELRRLSLDLRPGILDDLGLIPAIRWLVSNLNQDGINARIKFEGKSRKLSSEVDINIFRIIQEALNNIRRHSKATEAYVNLEFNPDLIKVLIQDNGNGFSLPKTSELMANGKLGLLGMQQRVQFLNGTFSLDSEPGKGTRIQIEVKA